jgi:hypothetical protein
MKSLSNQKDVQQTSKAGDKNQKNYIKIKKGKNFIRLLSLDYESQFTHALWVGKKFTEVVCLGGEKNGGYAPDQCPICKEAKENYWDKIKTLKDNPKFDKSKEMQAKAEKLKADGKKLQAKQSAKFIAVYGEAVREKVDGKIEYTPEWEKEAKILTLSKTQFNKLGIDIYSKYDFIKSSENLIDRNLIFSKEAPKGEEVKDNTPIEIIPCKSKSKAPTVENELPDLKTAYHEVSEEEMEKILKEYNGGAVEFEETDDDLTDDNDEENEDDDLDIDDSDLEDDDEDEFEEEKPKSKKETSKKEPKKSEKKSKKEVEDEDDEF